MPDLEGKLCSHIQELYCYVMSNNLQLPECFISLLEELSSDCHLSESRYRSTFDSCIDKFDTDRYQDDKYKYLQCKVLLKRCISICWEDHEYYTDLLILLNILDQWIAFDF